ncbi:P2X purinoceptor 4 [Biomphalaria glabrata]|nr:P2X purinoceptor 4 [Biomphalaria glabrata]
MSRCSPLLAVASAFLFEYNTPRIVHIKSKKVGVTNRLLQLGIISYIIGFVLVYKKGYQDFDTVQSAVTTKVKGIALSNQSHLPDIGLRTWDVADYVIPPQENNAAFVMTNVIPTLGQTQSTCPEDPSIKGSNCTDDSSYCSGLKGTILDKGNGPFTGRCVNSTDGVNKVCEIYGWCQVENSSGSGNVINLVGSQNFTLFIKNDIAFPKFDVKRRNILNIYKNDNELSSCRWNSSDSKGKYCPILLLGDIALAANQDYDKLAQKGAILQIVIDWTCDLDKSVDECLPEYSFKRLDSSDYNVSNGFNFRYADYYALKDNDTLRQYRNLYKATGIMFVITVQGKAGKFNVIPLILNFSSGLALLTITVIICDVLVLYFLQARSYYREYKYLQVEGRDAFQITYHRNLKIFDRDGDHEHKGTSVKRDTNPTISASYDGHGTDT